MRLDSHLLWAGLVARAPRTNIQHRLAPIRTARHDHGFDQECQEKTATGQYESQRIVQSWRERTKLVSTAAQKVYKAGTSEYPASECISPTH